MAANHGTQDVDCLGFSGKIHLSF